jgi:integrase
MTPRRRSPSRRDWPPYLYERRGIYFWRHPVTRQEYPLGKNRVHAFNEAIAANRYLVGAAQASLVDKLTGNAERSLAAFIPRYLETHKSLSPNTLKGYRSLAKRTIDTFGADTPVTAITPLMIAEEVEKLGPRRITQAWRGFLRDMFREACMLGWLDANPVRDTRRLSIEVKRERLTWDAFLAVYAETDGWLRNAIALGITTGQRREDIVSARFADVRDGHWWVEQGKTGMRLQIPLDLRLDGFMSVGDAIRQCRTTGALSPYLIHHTTPRAKSPVGSPVHPDTLSRRFTDAVELAGVGGDHPPTFHELRSLAARRYALQGQNAQVLLGHKSAGMTEVYKDVRGAEWTRVTIAN